MFVCYSLELPWKDNARNISCIRAGRYNAEKFIRGGHPALRLFDVPGRDGILMHIGNGVKDTQGCILPGLDWHEGLSRVVYSQLAMMVIARMLPDKFTVNIIDVI